MLIVLLGSTFSLAFVLFVAFGGLRRNHLRLPLKYLLEEASDSLSAELERQASRTFSFTSFGIQKKARGTPPQTSPLFRLLGWQSWGIRQFPKTTPKGNKCDAPLTLNTKVYLTSMDDEWEICEIMCLARFPTLPIAILLQNTKERSKFILSFSGFKFPISWPFPGVRTGLPLSLIQLAIDNFRQVRHADTFSPLSLGNESKSDNNIVVNRVALKYLDELEQKGGADEKDKTLSAVVEGWLKKFEESSLLITGHSNGGSMAQVFSLKFAHRIHSSADGIVVSPSPSSSAAATTGIGKSGMTSSSTSSPSSNKKFKVHLACSAHGPMRTGNRAFYLELQKLGVQITCFAYAAPCYSDSTHVFVDEIPFAPRFDDNFQDAPEVFVMLTIKDRNDKTKVTRVCKRLDPTAVPISAENTALTAVIPSFPKNHVAGLYEDFFVKLHEQLLRRK